MNAVKRRKEEKHRQRYCKIYHRRHVFREQEYVLRHVDFRENVLVGHEGIHAALCRLLEKRKDKVSGEKIGGVMLDSAPEKLGEHYSHYKQRKQGRKYTPPHAQHRALVFLLEVPLDELFKHELVFF